MDINATVIIDAIRAEAEHQINDAVTSMYDDDTTYSDSVRRIGESLNSLADRIERATRPDPKPYVGFSGKRYQLDETTRASLEDGPVGFDPRNGYGATEDQR